MTKQKNASGIRNLRFSALGVYLQGMKTALASRMAYRGDFIMSMFIMMVVEFAGPVITLIIYKNGASFPGWSQYEVLLLQGIFLLSRGISFPFFMGMVWNTIGRVQEGTFDLLLIKPRSILLMTLATSFDSEDLGKLIGGILLFRFALKKLPPQPLSHWISFFILFLFSLILMFAFGLFMAGLGIIWVGNYRIYDIFMSVMEFGMYPKSIFTKSFQSVLTYIIPVSLLASYPASALLGSVDKTVILALVSSIVFLLLGFLFYYRMVKNYTSAGG
ncbi:ABC transporter permease [Thermoclostridium stercorarium]|uniref:ABC transporter permease n=1 Tax=Thermoclostridium stercorarium TaxID=1510 RepID=UPI0004AE8C95|nr:ABC-2 family transporter protein [Thermoclostridium stercorarium]UZQ85674.1 ABC transporter permease [Thermoclostridium stercorarium]